MARQFVGMATLTDHVSFLFVEYDPGEEEASELSDKL